MAKRGQWVRWGRGMCEGWTLDIGNAFRCSVVRERTALNEPHHWRATINTVYFGMHPDKESAIKRIEESIECDMRLVLYDWDLYMKFKARK
jgi:hypothetical protein